MRADLPRHEHDTPLVRMPSPPARAADSGQRTRSLSSVRAPARNRMTLSFAATDKTWPQFYNQIDMHPYAASRTQIECTSGERDSRILKWCAGPACTPLPLVPGSSSSTRAWNPFPSCARTPLPAASIGVKCASVCCCLAIYKQSVGVECR
jgi:hypothetical protein